MNRTITERDHVPSGKKPTRGLTLMELLVTIMIMGIMIAVAVPVIRPPVDARSVKEAARMVSTALASARTKSIETGQSWGVQFTPLGSDPRQVGTLHFVRSVSPSMGTGTVTGGVWSGGLTTSGTLRLNGYLDYACPDDGSGSLEGTLSHDPPPDGSYDFQFYPAPQKSSLMPIQLPSRAVVDMGLSGVGTTYGLTNTPVKITFTQTGEVDKIHDLNSSVALSDRLYLLIGKPGKTSDTADASDSEYESDEQAREDNNLLDGENIWVSINPRTGAVQSAEIRPVLNTEIDEGNLPQAVNTARQFISGQTNSDD